MRRAPLLALLGAALVRTSLASADEADTKRADALYQEALALAEKGNYAAACPKYDASQKLDPALGTQFNLADCWEHVGLLASAYGAFGTVERAARAAGKTNLATRAHDRGKALEPRVARLVIAVRPLPELAVRVDGVEVSAASLSSYPVDPGDHEIAAAAPGHVPFRRKLTVAGASTTVQIGVLPPVPAPVERRPARGYRIAGAAIGGAGVVALVLGAVAGSRAISKRNEARDVCGNAEPSQCHAEAGVPIWDSASTAGTLSTIGFVAGGALVASGAALWFLAPLRPLKAQVGLGNIAIGGTF